ncbi:NAD(P)/FAD-dependent oxidoreductase [Arcanobacterium haemolyticum]|nr:NAD(P)/FAD-dependent oxidoreductase [Arcanobacterium haemolyticum]
MNSRDTFPRTTRPHVVVIGGGFAGLNTVRKLRHADVDITLIDRHTYNTFQPLIYQVATAALNPGDVTWFLRAVRSNQKNVRFVRGTVEAIDHDAREVTLDGNVTVKYDYLVVASGVTANFFGIPGAEENSYPLYRRSHALRIRDKLFAKLEDAAMNSDDVEDLRIVVVGGGPTGVETAGALAEMRNLDMPVTYPELDPAKIHITLVEMSPNVLGPFHASLRDYAKESLEKRGVDLRLGTAVKEVRADGVVVESHGTQEFLNSELVIWASGVTAHASVANWNLPQGRGGRIEVDEHQRVRGFRNVFAVGDISVNPDNPLPQLAQPAMQGGQHVASVIKAELAGKDEPTPFRYVDKGTMATIGRASAIAQISGLPRLKGFPAWAIWVGVHVAQLLGNRNRFATMTNLSLKYIGWRSHNAIVGETPYIAARRPKVIDSIQGSTSAESAE